MPINDDLFVTDTHMSVFENNNDQCPDFGLTQASCAIKVICDRLNPQPIAAFQKWLKFGHQDDRSALQISRQALPARLPGKQVD
ncbi:hypothetical protein PSJE_26770 [Pseudomonas jessenii]|jgi:hypothetical protein|nr:hypothetical protein PSJE_26770 [Pseudomonas jessenii]